MPKVTVATWGFGDPGPVDGRRRTQTLKLHRLPRQLMISEFNPKQGVHVKQSRLEDLEPKEAEHKSEKLGEGGMA